MLAASQDDTGEFFFHSIKCTFIVFTKKMLCRSFLCLKTKKASGNKTIKKKKVRMFCKIYPHRMLKFS
jgi:hypothetical protein